MKQKTKGLLAGIAFGGLGVVLLFVALRAATVSVLANEGAPGRAGAWTLGRPSGVSASAVSEWLPFLEDSYDGTYADRYTIPRVVGTTGAPYQWGRVTRSDNPFTDTLWCVRGWNGADLVPGTDVYTDGVNTTITYGPLDMSKVVTAALSFRTWISVADGDGLEWGVSTTGIPEDFESVTPSVAGAWETKRFDSKNTPALGSVVGKNGVYVAFRFRSNDDGRVAQGVFLDDFKLWSKVYSRVHVPLVFGPQPTPTATATPTATPTPTPTATPGPGSGYRENFSDPTSGWPREWERKNSGENMRGGYMVDRRPQVLAELLAAREAEGDVAPMAVEDQMAFLGLDDDVYYSVVHDAWDRAFISGPYKVDGDFDLVVDARYSYVKKSYDGNRYGILLTKEKVNPEDPHSIHGYSFMVEIKPLSTGGFAMPWWRFKEWYRTNWQGDDKGDEDRSMGDDPSPAIHSSLGSWNTLRIERRGTSFHLFINGTYVRTVTDGDNTGPLYVGLIGRHTGSGTTELSYDVLYEWDNIKVTPR